MTPGAFSVTVDNTRPTGTNVQTTNAGTAGQPGIGDTMTLTFSEQIDPQTVLAGWTGTSTNVVVRITQAAGGDQVTLRNAANTAVLPLGTVNLVGTNYVTVNRDFGATGTPSTMVQSGNAITVTLGTPSGAVATQAAANDMIWTPSATATDRAGNTCQTTNATEAVPLDIDFSRATALPVRGGRGLDLADRREPALGVDGRLAAVPGRGHRLAVVVVVDVARDEDALDPRSGLTDDLEVAAGTDLELALEQVGVRLVADGDEHALHRQLGHLAADGVAHRERVHGHVALHLGRPPC